MRTWLVFPGVRRRPLAARAVSRARCRPARAGAAALDGAHPPTTPGLPSRAAPPRANRPAPLPPPAPPQSEDMQQDAIDTASQAMEKFNIEKDIAAYIKKECALCSPHARLR